MTSTLVYGDAITNEVAEIDRRLRAWGFETHVYAEHIEPRVRAMARQDEAYARWLNEPDDLLIYHYSVYSANLDLYRRSRNRKMVIYHNITPPEFFHGFSPSLESVCRLGRWSLSSLRGCDLALADSDYNRRELVQAGIPEAQTDVLPVFLNLDEFAAVKPDARLTGRLLAHGGVNLLFVSRIAPNKAFEELIKTVRVYIDAIDRRVHLWLVGTNLVPAYKRFLIELTARLGVERHVTFTDRVSLSELRACYEAADVFICPSRHEGFGVPLVESMYFGVPILAYDATAAPETLGGAGVLFKAFDHAVLAETAYLLATDTGLRTRVIERQRERLRDFTPQRTEAHLRQALERVGAL